MPVLSIRRREDRRIWAAFRHHSRTFSLATRLLPGPVRMPIATLYLFCRTVDTIADDRILAVGADAALRELDATRDRLARALDGRPDDAMLWRRLAEVHEQYDLPAGPLYELIDGAHWDLTGRTVESSDDLLHYAGLVGGSVGAMMLPFLVERPGDRARLEAPARALGDAMQITNICRDVGEDRRRLGRLYLPRDWCEATGIGPADLDNARPPAGYEALMERMMTLAEARYRAAFDDISGLRPGVRAGIRAAGRMYREILNEVRANGYDNLTRRAYVPFTRKLRVILRDRYAQRRAALHGGSATPVMAR